eukprot:scaffold15304_cov72-Phaeocystis_antarctica.AAC.8
MVPGAVRGLLIPAQVCTAGGGRGAAVQPGGARGAGGAGVGHERAPAHARARTCGWVGGARQGFGVRVKGGG